MKIEFEGRVYDTQKATLLVTYTNALSITDDHYEDAYLYVKDDGEFFLHCHGGSKSEYAIVRDNKSYAGECIIPLMNEKFNDWIMNHEGLIKFMMFLAMAKKSALSTK